MMMMMMMMTMMMVVVMMIDDNVDDYNDAYQLLMCTFSNVYTLLHQIFWKRPPLSQNWVILLYTLKYRFDIVLVFWSNSILLN